MPTDLFNQSHSNSKTPRRDNQIQFTNGANSWSQLQEDENKYSDNSIKRLNRDCHYKDSKFFFLSKNRHEDRKNFRILKRNRFESVRDPYNF